MATGGDAHERVVGERKRALLGDLHGTVLEIGPGAGPNLSYYPRDIRWIGVEPNPYMDPYLQHAAEKAGLPIEIRRGSAERIDLDDGSVDAVVSTLVLCSVGDLDATLREIHRVLRPGGRFVFVEHVAAATGTWSRWLQDAIQPAWGLLADGCRPNRETWAAVEGAGFSRVQIEHFQTPFPIVGPHIAGVATK